MINTKHLPDAMSLVSFMVVFVSGPNSAALRGGIFEIGTQREHQRWLAPVTYAQFQTSWECFTNMFDIAHEDAVVSWKVIRQRYQLSARSKITLFMLQSFQNKHSATAKAKS